MKEEKLRIEMEKSLRDIELKALHYQINPHFLFNVLNTIGRLAFFENAKMTEDACLCVCGYDALHFEEEQ